MMGAVLANRSAIDRNKTDFYETPPEVTTALLDFLEARNLCAPGMTIWEPAAGRGKLAEVIKARGYRLECTDLYDQGCGEGGVNFLEARRECDWIITNPPFSIAADFIGHALELGNPCAFLLKSQFWHAKSRVKIFREFHPSYVLPLTWRPDFLFGAKSGSPTMECIWTVWSGGDRCEYRPLEKP